MNTGNRLTTEEEEEEESPDRGPHNSSTGDEYFGAPIETDSDSGDSFFITQHSVLEPKRPRKKRQRTVKVVDSPSDSDEEYGPTETSSRKSTSLPKYIFPFLLGRRKRAELIYKHNKSIHSFTIGGFFKCVKELWESGQRGDHLPSFLPTSDLEGEDIPPLSENEDEMSESAEIKVVEKRRLVSTLKALPFAQKRKKRTVGERDKLNPDGQRACGGKQRKCGKRSSEMDNLSKDGRHRLVEAEEGTSDAGNRTTHTRVQNNELAAELSDSEQKLYRSKKRRCRGESLRIAECQAHVSHTGDQSQPESQSLLQSLPEATGVTRAKKRKKKKNNKEDDDDVDVEHQQVRTVPKHGDVGLKKKKQRKTETPVDVEVLGGEEAEVRACISHVMEGETENGFDDPDSSQIGLEAAKDPQDNKDLSWSQDILSKESAAQSVKKKKKKKKDKKKRRREAPQKE